MSRLRVHVLGVFSIGAGVRTLPVATSCRPVLGYLLANRERGVSRAELAGALWGDTSGEHARGSLSTALWRFKRSLGSHATHLIVIGGDEISLNPAAHAWVDCIAFEHRIAPLLRNPSGKLSARDLVRLERALRLYRGDFLAGLEQDWAWIERQRLRSTYCDGLYLLISAYAAASQWEPALRWALQLNREEPLREDVHRLLMTAHWQLGNRASAVAQYQACERLLATQLGVRPMTETRNLARQLMLEHTPPRPSQSSKASSSELDTARRRIARVRRALAASQQQLDRALNSLNSGPADAQP